MPSSRISSSITEPRRNGPVFPILIGATSATAWLIIWRVGPTGSGHALHAQASHHAAHAASTWAPAAMFVGGWTLMTVAMMLPTTVPLVRMFERLTSARPHSARLVSLLLAGYLSAWLACGVLVFAASRLIQSSVDTSGSGVVQPGVPAALLLVIAGAFQFSRLKYRCLDRCRSPFGFLQSRWHGLHERWESFRLGVAHGLFCVGCCWALMLLMFAFGTMHLFWMIVLGAVMAIEKNATWGRRISAPVGWGLLASGAAILIVSMT